MSVRNNLILFEHKNQHLTNLAASELDRDVM